MDALGLVRESYDTVCPSMLTLLFWHSLVKDYANRDCSAFPGRVFQVFAPRGPQISIPPNMMDEVKALSDSVLSVSDGIREVQLFFA